eukprot:GHVN01036266.1.p1 GENE.GHVN01036266.1~~GHVN01036266.1.p1  ORF type:complete len:115 (+),score=2.26 GHVN01036266.1:879-1223(+)
MTERTRCLPFYGSFTYIFVLISFVVSSSLGLGNLRGPSLALREPALPTVIPPDLFDGARNKFDGLTSRTLLGDYDTTNKWLAQNLPLLSSSPSTLGPLVARRAMSRNKSRRNRL